MPRKFKSPASTAQNRESQRQSRVRRRELVDDLQRRLNEYERRGIAASLEMQAAARAVNAENRGLRALLELEGVNREQVDRYLASHKHSTHGKPSRTPREKTGDQKLSENARGNLALPNDQRQRETFAFSPAPNTPQAPPPPHPQASSSSSSSPPGHIAAAQPGSPEATTKAPIPFPRATMKEETTNCSEKDEHQREADESSGYAEDAACSSSKHVLPPVSDCFCPPEISTCSLVKRTPLEMSCDAAAEILVELHDQADPTQARVTLGCTRPSNCSVQNVKMFQLMDRLS